jgi:hypothetical protein
MLAAVRMLEHPTRGRQLTVLALVVVSILARMQAIAFLPGLAIAVAVFAGADGRGGFRARLRPFAATAVALGAIVVAGAAYVAVEHASAVGAYSVVLSNGFSPLGTLRWAAGNLADVDMLLGFALFAVAPFAVAAAIRPETATPASRAIAAVLVGFGGTSLLMVAAFSTSTQGGNREHVRYLIYFVPLLVMLSLRWLVAPGAVSRSRLGAAAVVAAALPIALPLERMRTASWVDSFGAAPWLNNVLPTQHLRVVCVAVAVCVAVGVVVAGRRRLAFVLATFLVAGFVGFTTAGGHAHLMGRYAVSSPGWIDRSVGRHAHVDAIYVARPCLTVFQRQDRLIRLWRSAFFNRSVRLTYFVGAPVPDVVTSKRLAVAGGPARVGGRLLRPRYVLVQRPVSVAGTLIDTAGGFALVRPSWPLRLTLPPRSYLDGCRRRR